MLSVNNPQIFSEYNSIFMTPVVSAEWNYNSFMPPYVTMAGDGDSKAWTTTPTVLNSTTIKKDYFTTKRLEIFGSDSFSYSINTGLGGNAYKVVTYAKIDIGTPAILNTKISTTNAHQFGSASAELNSSSWTKIETYIGSEDAISDMTFTMSVENIYTSEPSQTFYIYFTVPEIYETTLFDFKYNSLWPTDSPFRFFRPGESYVKTGNINIQFPNNYRRVATQVGDTETQSGGYYGNKYMPISPLCYSPTFAIAKNPQSVIMKNGAPTNLMPYQYFVSDIDEGTGTANKILTGIYETDLNVNKIVIKFNTIITSPSSVTVSIDGVALTPVSPFVPDSRGVLTLYWNGTTWTTTNWSNMPVFNDAGALSLYTTLKKITVQTVEAQTTAFSGSEYNAIDAQSNRMQVVEVSPRLEIDVSNFVESININKSLDANNQDLPLSSIDSNDASIILSGIPGTDSSYNIIPIFSNNSDYDGTILRAMMRKNVKLYINFYAKSAFELEVGQVQLPSNNVYIPGGIFYADSWSENDIDSVQIQCFDVSRYLQSLSAPDYVASIKPIFEVITNILDLAGFTDYDYDTLYNVCNDPRAITDLAYYFSNSREVTVIAALSEIFLAYQIGAYIDEYGVMKFLSLSDILDPALTDPNQNPNIIEIDDTTVVAGTLSSITKEKVGKISLRYSPPRIKQSASMANITNPDIKNSPSFVLTTSNDINWSQQNIDSVGFNYLNDDMQADDNKYKLDVNDLLDIFRTYNLSSSGFAAIEDEIVTFKYKEYNISLPKWPFTGGSSQTKTQTVSVTSDIELASYINSFIKKYSVGLQESRTVLGLVSGNIFGRGINGFQLVGGSNFQTGFNKGGKVWIRRRFERTYSSGGAPGSVSLTITASSANLKAGQRLVGTGLAENTIVTKVDGTNIQFFPAAVTQVSGTLNFIFNDQWMYGTIVNNDGSLLTVNVEDFVGPAATLITAFEFQNVPTYNIEVAPTGFITNVQRGVFNTRVSDHNILDTNISTQKALSQASVSSSYVITPGGANLAINNNKIDVTTPANQKILVYPTTERDEGYHTYSTKFTIINDDSVAGSMGGIFFNLDSTLSNMENTYFVEIIKYNPEYAVYPVAQDKAKYYAVVYKITSTLEEQIIAYSDVTSSIGMVTEGFPGLYVLNESDPLEKYNIEFDEFIHLKVVHQEENISDGNVLQSGDSTISVFLNNIEVSGWQIAGLYSQFPVYTSTTTETIVSSGTVTIDVSGEVEYDNTDGSYPNIYIVDSTNSNNFMLGTVTDVTYAYGVSSIDVDVILSSGSGTLSSWNIYDEYAPQNMNFVTGTRRRVSLPVNVTDGTIFGSCFTTRIIPSFPTSVIPSIPSTTKTIFNLREIYATQTPLIDNSISYYYQSRNFLNGIILGQRNTEKTYCMQTKPEVVGINYYDVEYDNPAAVATDVYPIEYIWHYFPTNLPTDQQYRQSLIVNESSVAYSTVVNTGFRGKFMIANNSPFVVYLNKEPDDISGANPRLNVWTHELIAPSDQQIIDRVIDPTNMSQVVEIDSEWIQSTDAANKVIAMISAGIDGFSKDVSIEIYGNPLIQVGDVIKLTYPLKGINQQYYIVRNISNGFSDGLTTTLGLNMIKPGIPFNYNPTPPPVNVYEKVGEWTFDFVPTNPPYALDPTFDPTFSFTELIPDFPSTGVQSTAQFHSSPKSALVTWVGTNPTSFIPFYGLGALPDWADIIGIRLTAWVYVPTGSPNVRLTNGFGQAATPPFFAPYIQTSLKNQWVKLELETTPEEWEYLFTGEFETDYVVIEPDWSGPTSGTVYIDDIKVEAIYPPA